MWPASLIEELDRPLSRGSRSKVLHEVSQGILEISIVRHESWRKKLFDTEGSRSAICRWHHCGCGHGWLAGGRSEIRES